MWAQQIFWQILVNFSIKGRNMHSKSINFVEMTLFIATLICIQRKYSKQMGRKAFIGSELFFSDTVHKFLQVLTLIPINFYLSITFTVHIRAHCAHYPFAT